MKIVVIGSGAIGSLVAGYLKLKDRDVSLIGRPDAVMAIKNNGLNIKGVRGEFNISIGASERLSDAPDLAILAVKTQDIDESLSANKDLLKDAIVVTTQNGVQAEVIASRYIPKENIVSSIVMFGSTYLEAAKIVHNFEGSWIIAKAFGRNNDLVEKAKDILSESFSMVVSDNIRGMKYLKVFVNANNCIPAILGMSMQEAFRDHSISRISIAIWKEGLSLVGKSGISLTSLPDFPVERITKLTAMPIDEAAKIFSEIMSNLSQEPLYG